MVSIIAHLLVILKVIRALITNRDDVGTEVQKTEAAEEPAAPEA